MHWRPDPPLRFLKPAATCRRCGLPTAQPRTFALCLACDDPADAYRDPPSSAGEDEDGTKTRQVAANRLAVRRFDHYAAVLAAAEAAGWALYRSDRSARSLSLYLEHVRPDAPGDPAGYRKTRVSDHDRRPKHRGAGFREDWADLSAEFLFDPSLSGLDAAEALKEVKRSAAEAFKWPPGRPA